MVLAILGICTVLSQSAVAATRLGLHVTQEELNIWKQRAVSGPYRVQGDVRTNSPGDWDRISRYATVFYNNPTAEQWTGSNLNPVDIGGDGCVTGTSAAPNDNPGIAQYAMNAAFYIMVNPGDSRAATIASALRTFLLASATGSRLQFGNTALWCVPPLGDTPVFLMGAWMVRMIHTYDYLLIYDATTGRTTLSSSDKTTLNAWFNAAGQFYKNMFIKRENVAFVNAAAGNYTFTGTANADCTQNGSVTYIIYDGGPTSTLFHDYWNNRNSHDILVAGLAGILTQDTALTQTAIRFAKEVLTYVTAPDGTSFELSRAEPLNNEPNLGWRYAGVTLALMVELADALARNGDTSLYDWSTTLSVTKGTSGCVLTNTTTKTLKSIITTYIKYADHTILRYSNGYNGQSNYIIDADNALTGQNAVHYLWGLLGNLYWRDTYIKQMYTLTPGNGPYTPSYPPGDQVSFTSGWSGASGSIAGILFMFGDMEGKVWPYPGTNIYPNAPENLRVISTAP
jgi:hypothetical protein